jgi:hypothetical protein
MQRLNTICLLLVVCIFLFVLITQTDINYNKSDQNSSIVHLDNDSFCNGTYRIIKSGLYKICEDITFCPPVSCLQTYQNLPGGIGQAYNLGFFAAITIEADNVILDLQGYTIKQSKKHYLHQRFFACVELGHSPFMPKQGPIPFTDTFRGPSCTVIKNGTLGLSSHHGIHGNVAYDLILKNLTICDFEVGGIALNGCTCVDIGDCSIGPGSVHTPVNSFFSHSKALQLFLQDHEKECLNDVSLCLHDGRILTRKSVYNALIDESSTSTLFTTMNSPFPEGNMYGIVLNSAGVVVNALPTTRDDNKRHVLGNYDISLHNIYVHGIKSCPIETKALLRHKTSQQSSYGLHVQKDNIGAVFQLDQCTDSTTQLYKGNIVSDAQLWLSVALPNTCDKLTNIKISRCPFASHKRTSTPSSTISPRIIDWVQQSNNSVEHYIDTEFIGGGDTMAHIMKGNMGILINQGKNIHLHDVEVDGVSNKMSTTSSYKHHSQNPIVCGESSFGILINSSVDISMKKVDVKNVYSLQGDEYVEHICIIGDCQGIDTPVKKKF